MAVAARVFGEEPAPARGLHHGAFDRLVVGIVQRRGTGRLAIAGPSGCAKNGCDKYRTNRHDQFNGTTATPAIVNDSVRAGGWRCSTRRFSSLSAGICRCFRCGWRRAGSIRRRSASCSPRCRRCASSRPRPERASPTAMARCSGASSVTAVATVAAMALLGSASGLPFDPVRGRMLLAFVSRAGVAADRRLWAQRPGRCAASAYGPVRLWGSVAFIAANLAGGVLLDMLAPRNLIWLIFAGQLRARARGAAAGAARRARPARARSAQPGHSHSAPAGVSRHRGGRKPDPGEPRGLLRLLDARLERARLRRRHHRRAVGARRRWPRSCCSRSRRGCRPRSAR